MIHMDRNTSPLPPLSHEALMEAVGETALNEYPSVEIDRFKHLYADYYDIGSDTVEVANGSDEWIQKAIMTLGRDGVMTLEPDFVMYHEYARQIDVPVHTIPCNEDFLFDFSAVIGEVEAKRPSLFLISMPHNPTGQMFSPDDLQQLADAMASHGGYLILDEAYYEFASPYVRPTGQHVLVIRTLSKMFGVAGLRIGIAIGEGEAFRRITRINHPYPVNSLSLNIASRIFEDREALEAFIEYQLESKRQLTSALSNISDEVTVLGSSTNFIFTYGEKARDLGHFMKTRGYQPRMYDTAPLDEAVRYSIIKLEDYDRFNQLIKEWSNRHDQQGTHDKRNGNLNSTR